MSKIVKRYTNLFFITLLLLAILVISPTNVWAQYHIQYNSEADRVLYLGGNTLRGNFATRSEAEAYQRSRPQFEINNSQIVGPDHTNTGATSTSGASQNILQGAVNSFIDGLLKPTDNSRQEKLNQEARQKEQERIDAEEQHKKMSLEEWQKFQTEEEMRRQMEKDTKTKQGEDLLPQMKTLGNEGDLQPFSIENSNQDASVVDLKRKSGTAQLFTTEDEQRRRDYWMQENGFNDLAQINSDNVIDENGNQPAERTWGEAALRTAIGEAYGLAGVTGSGMLNVVDKTIGGIENVVNEFTNGNDAQALENANKLPGNIVVNSVKTTVSDWASDKITEISYCPLLNTVPGANELYKYLKLGYDVWENKKGK